MGHPTANAPSVILADALYSRRGFIAASGVSETRIREGSQRGIKLPWIVCGKRKFIRGSDAIWFIEQLATMGAAT